MYKVFMTGADTVKWATADDFNLLKMSLSSFCEFTSVEDCDIIHSVNWHALSYIDTKYLSQKYVISHIPHDVKNMLMQSNYLKIMPFVDKWVVMSERAKRMLAESGMKGDHVPYPIDLDSFYKINKNDPKLISIIDKYNIPKDKYLIGSFQRDTEGADLKTPKYMKGPDVFLEIVKNIYANEKGICVILAGPRRFWLIDQLTKLSIPHIYIGKKLDGIEDDIDINTLPHEDVNYLYNIIDSYVVSSRMEGGPKAILECAASKCKIISTDVGQASDTLTLDTIYYTPIEGSNIILNDIKTDDLSRAVEINYKTLSENNSIESISKSWNNIYENIAYKGSSFKKESRSLRFSKPKRMIFGKPVITILHNYHKPPWGGGNQFLMALKDNMEKKGYKVLNKPSKKTTMNLFNSFTFDLDIIHKAKKNKNCLFVHRVDGPTVLIRGKDKELDDKVFEINNDVADVTVFQSFWSLKETTKLGYKPVNPIIISNAVDDLIFNRNAKHPFSKERKIRLISASWSSNKRKGFGIYKWLDDNLDFDRYEYTFVGNVPEGLEFKNITHIKPIPSNELATQLKRSDIYITASQNDPCSNALIEALACGLPSLYLNDGGHPELVGFGGLPFNDEKEILTQLDNMIDNYLMYQNLTVVPSMDHIANKYLEILVNVDRNLLKLDLGLEEPVR